MNRATQIVSGTLSPCPFPAFSGTAESAAPLVGACMQDAETSAGDVELF